MEHKKKLARAPVSIGQLVDLKIISTGEKGDGMGKISGYCIFVPNAEIDKTYRVKITRTLPKVGFAEILEELQEI